MKLYSILLTVFIIVAVLAGFCFVSELKATDNSDSPVKIIPIYRTNGTVTFQVRTVTNHGQFSPRNIGAIWVTTESGTFVKTLQRWGNSYLQHLTRWHAATPQGNTTGAITGATMSNHNTLHNLTWNCTNTSNVEVPDGNYKVWVEFTESNGAGPYTSVTFTKGANAIHLTPANLTYFQSIVLDFTPSAVIGAPTNLQATVTATNTVNLSWSAPASTVGLTGYKVYRNGAVITTISSPATTTYTDSPALGSYNYYATAMFGTTESTQSNIASVSVNPIVSPPANLQAAVVTPNVNLTWTAPAITMGMSSYKVYRDSTMIMMIPTITTTSYTDAPGAGNHAYYVTAMFGTTESIASNMASVTVVSNQDGTQLPAITALKGNYPNPFNPETHISFTLAKNEYATLTIYNYKGQKVRDLRSGNMTAGQHLVTWNGTDDNGKAVASGLYYYKLETAGKTLLRKMVLLK